VKDQDLDVAGPWHLDSERWMKLQLIRSLLPTPKLDGSYLSDHFQ